MRGFDPAGDDVRVDVAGRGVNHFGGRYGTGNVGTVGDGGHDQPDGLPAADPGSGATDAAALLVIDPRMTDADRYVRRTVDTCDDIRNGEVTGDALVYRIQKRFSGGTMPDFSPEQAQQVIDSVVRVWCH